MQSQQAQVDAVKTDIRKTNAAIAKANVGIKTAERYCKGGKTMLSPSLLSSLLPPPSLPLPSLHPSLFSPSSLPAFGMKLYFPLYRNTVKCKKKVASLEEEAKELEARKEELRVVLTSLEDEAREILAKQEQLRVGGALKKA